MLLPPPVGCSDNIWLGHLAGTVKSMRRVAQPWGASTAALANAGSDAVRHVTVMRTLPDSASARIDQPSR